MAKQININLNFSADTERAKQQIVDLQKSLEKVSKSTMSVGGSIINDKSLRDASDAALDLQKHLKAAVNTDTGKLDLARFSTSLKQSNTTLDQLYRKLNLAGREGQEAFTKLSQAIATAEAPTTRMNKALTNMGTVLKNTARWQISSSILHSFMGSLQSAYGYAKDLNESLNNIRIVTGQNTDQMAKFAEQANKAAKSLSTSTTAYTDAALIYYQQGLGDQDVKARTDTTIKMANVTGDSATEVSSYMTAIWNNFAKGSEDLERFADVITALGASTASSSSEIAAGLEKFAAIGDTIGLSYDYATSILSALVANTRQSADVVGTALKSIFVRLQGLNLGETLDDGVTLNKYSKALKAVGVDILDTNGKMKTANDILDETALKWETLGKEQKTALAQTVAGQRQYSQFMAMMENWGDVEKNLVTAANAEGTLQKQADIYAESWEAARDRVRASAQGVYDSLINEKFFIGFDNTLAKVLERIENVIDSLGGMGGVLNTVSGIFMTLYARKMPEVFSNLAANIAVFTGKARADMIQLQQDSQKAISNKTINYEAVDPYSVRARSIEILHQMQKKLLDSDKVLSDAEKDLYKRRMDNVAALGEMAVKTAEVVKAAQKEAAAEKKRLSQNNRAETLAADLIQTRTNQQEDRKNKTKTENKKNKITTKLEEQDKERKNAERRQKTAQSGVDRHQTAINALKEQKVNQNGLDDTGKQQLAREGLELTKAKEKLSKENQIVKDLKKSIEQNKKDVEALDKTIEESANAIKTADDKFDKYNEALKNLGGKTIAKGELDAGNSTSVQQKIDTGKSLGMEKLQSSIQSQVKLKTLSDRDGEGLLDLEQNASRTAEDILESARKYAEAAGLLDDAHTDLINAFDSGNIEEVQNEVRRLTEEEEKLEQETRENLVVLEGDSVGVDAYATEIHNAAMETEGLRTQQLRLNEEGQINPKAFPTSNVEAFSKAVSAAQLAVSAMTTVQNAYNTIMDENATGMEKLTAVVSALSIATMASGSIHGAYTAIITSEAAAAITAAAANGTLAASIYAVLTPLLPIVALIGGLVSVVVLLNNRLNASEKAFNNTAKSVENVKTSLTEANSALTELKDSFSNWDSAIKGLSELKTGTEEYTEALKEANGQLVDLYSNNPKLREEYEIDTSGTQYRVIDKNSKKQVSSEDFEKYIKNEELKLSNRENLSSINLNNASFAKANGRVTTDTLTAINSEAFSKDKENIYGFLGTRLTKEDFEAILKSVQDTSSFEKALKNAGIKENTAVYKALMNSENGLKEQVKNLAKTTAELTETNKLLLNETIRNTLSQDDQYNDLSPEAQAALANKVQEEVNNKNIDGKAIEQATEEYAGKTVDTLVEEWKNEKGATTVTNEKGKYTFRDNNGNIINEGLTESELRDLLINIRATEITEDNIKGAASDKYGSFARIDTGFSNAGQTGLWNLGSNFDASKVGLAGTKAIENFLNSNSFDSFAKNLSKEDWENLGAESAEAYKKALLDQIQNPSYQRELKESTQENFAGATDNFNNLRDAISGGSLDYSNLETNADYIAIKSTLDDIKELYPELADEVEIFTNKAKFGTAEWTKATLDLKDAAEIIDFKKVEDEYDKAWADISKDSDNKILFDDEDGGFLISPKIDDEEFEKQFKKILDVDRVIEVAIEADSQDALADFTAMYNEIDRAASKIGDDFKVSQDDLNDLVQAFPGITEGMSKLADGSLKLNEDVAQAVVQGAKDQVDAKKTALIESLNIDKEYLESRKKSLENILKILESGGKAETGQEKLTADDKSKINKELNNTKIAQNKWLEEKKNTLNKESVDNLSKNNEEEFENTFRLYQTKLTLDKEYNIQRIKNSQATNAADVSDALTKGSLSQLQATLNQTSDPTANGDEAPAFDTAGLEALLNNNNTSRQEMWKETKSELDAVNEALKGITDSRNRIEALGGSIDQKLKNVANGLGTDGKKSGSSSSSKEKENKDYITDKPDKEHDINRKISETQHQLDMLSKTQEHLFGYQLANSITKQNKLLHEQLEQYKELGNVLEEDKNSLQEQLAEYGMLFDADSGEITNYAENYQKAIDDYNKAISDYNTSAKETADKDQLDSEKKKYENYTKLLQEYEKKVDAIRENEKKKLELLYEEIANNLKKFETRITINLDLAAARKEWNKFWNTVKSDFRLEGTDFITERKNLGNTFNLNARTVRADIKKVNEAQNAIETGNYGKEGSKFTTLSEAQNTLLQWSNSLREDALDLYNTYQDAWNNYLSQIDSVIDKWNEMVEKFDKFNSSLEHYQKVAELLYGTNSKQYKDLLQQTQKTQVDNDLNRVTSLETAYTELKKQRNNAIKQEILSDPEIAKEIGDKRQAYHDSITKENSKAWKDAQEQFKALVKADGKSIKKLTAEEKADYTEKAETKAEENYRKKLEDAKVKELKANGEWSELRAEAVQKESVQKLQEALDKNREDLQSAIETYLTDAKTEFETAVSRAAETFEEALTNGISLDDFKQKWEDLVAISDDYYDGIQRVFQLESLQNKWQSAINSTSDLKAQQKLKKLMEEQNKELEKKTKLSKYNVELAEKQIALAQAQIALEEAQENKKTMKLVRNNEGNWSYQYVADEDDIADKENALLEKQNEYYTYVKNHDTELTSETITLMQEYSNKMKEIDLEYNGLDQSEKKRRQDELTASYLGEDGKLTSVLEQLIEADNDLANAGMFASGEDFLSVLTTSIKRDEASDTARQLLESNNKLSTSEIVQTLIKSYSSGELAAAVEAYKQNLGTASKTWETEVYALQKATGEDITKIKTAVNKIANESASTADDTKDLEKATSALSATATSLTSLAERFENLAGSIPNELTISVNEKGLGDYAEASNDPDKFTASVVVTASKNKNKNDKTSSYATGGYTGDWSDGSGKIGILHSKELILNASDTENMLQAVNAVRSISSLGSSISSVIANGISNMVSGLLGLGRNKVEDISTTQSASNENNTFNISAEFPNAENVEDIREAILSLPTLASQYLSQNKL